MRSILSGIPTFVARNGGNRIQPSIHIRLLVKRNLGMKNKGLLILLGYLLFTLGITSVVMELVGTHWYFMAWIEQAGRLTAFIIKILMVIIGILLIVFSRTDWERERRESMED